MPLSWMTPALRIETLQASISTAGLTKLLNIMKALLPHDGDPTTISLPVGGCQVLSFSVSSVSAMLFPGGGFKLCYIVTHEVLHGPRTPSEDQ